MKHYVAMSSSRSCCISCLCKNHHVASTAKASRPIEKGLNLITFPPEKPCLIENIPRMMSSKTCLLAGASSCQHVRSLPNRACDLEDSPAFPPFSRQLIPISLGFPPQSPFPHIAPLNLPSELAWQMSLASLELLKDLRVIAARTVASGA